MTVSSDLLGLDLERPADDLLGQRQAELDGTPLELDRGLELLLAHVLDGLRERGERRLQRGQRVGATGGEALGDRGLAQLLGLGLRLREDVHDLLGVRARRPRRGRRLERLEVEIGDDGHQTSASSPPRHRGR